MKKDLKIGRLLDCYGAMLTKRQAEIMESYYYYDFSLSEISENMSITRQAVHDAIVKAGEQLESLEDKLGFLKRNDLALTVLKNAVELLDRGDAEGARVVIVEFLQGI